MGIHIIIYKLDLESKDEEGYINFKDVCEEVDWDHIRRGGDRNFVTILNNLSTTINEKGSTDVSYNDRVFQRPTDFDEVRLWIQRDNEILYQTRYLDILKKMEEDPSLYFYISY